jgi:hypothetical protein
MAPNLFSVPGQIVSGRSTRAVPAQYTTDRSVVPSSSDIEGIANIARSKVRFVADMAARQYGPDSSEYQLLAEIRDRKSSVESEQARLRYLFQRWDNLYFPNTISQGGPDHWPEGVKPGRNHVSVNTPPVYVDIPASLQAVPPDENYIPASEEPGKRESADRAEVLYRQWKDDDAFELKVHKACIVKGLYGHTFSRVHWNPIEKRPTTTILESPENLYVGWGNSEYSRMDWAVYCYGLSEQAIKEDYDLDLDAEDVGDGKWMWYVKGGVAHNDPIGNVFNQQRANGRQPPRYEMGQIEVYDYWYKKATGKGKRPEIWNAIYVGNALVEKAKHAEYEDLPYDLLPNTFIPGQPYGKPELYDIEQLIREKEERLTNAGQMLSTMTDGQRWQIVGPEAPDEVPVNAIPAANKVAAPGPGNEIKAIQPFVAEYAAEDHLKRLDMEMEVVSGLNELLLGRAPATILGSSKAIAALVANYESRINMKRQLLYEWRKRTWRKAAKVWEAKDSKVKAIIDGQYRLDVKAPELTPHDNLEVAQMAMSLTQNRIWSSERAMNATGVEDPTSEKNVIREEQTDAALNPAAVQAQVTLMGALQAQGINPAQAGISQDQQANTDRTLNRPAPGTQSLNQGENQSNTPQAAPQNAQAPNGAKAQNQSLLQNGEAQGRIITSAPLNG